MKKTFKGFTLVECLVAMAILAIASTLMASIYANVNRRNNFNHFNNTSLANQMAYIEKYENAQTVKIEYDEPATPTTTPPSGTNSGTSAYVKITNSTTSESYSYPVDIYIMYSRDSAGQSSTNDDGTANNNYSAYASGISTSDTIKIINDDGSQSFTTVTRDGAIGNDNLHNLRYKYVLGH